MLQCNGMLLLDAIVFESKSGLQGKETKGAIKPRQRHAEGLYGVLEKREMVQTFCRGKKEWWVGGGCYACDDLLPSPVPRG
jgi:hypothetical protein